LAEPQGELNIDQELEELEIRLERLRSLYEQYFLGIEKSEPTVARKDVDRRIFVLRREKFRNTARRFKLQTIVQRYNTFQQYWYRICREIENGTYKRHLLRAAKNVGMTEPLTIAAKKRLGLYSRLKRDEADALEAPPPSHEVAPPSAPPSERPAAPAPAPRPKPAPAPIAPARLTAPEAKPREPIERLELDIDDMFGAPAPKPAAKPPPAVAAKPPDTPAPLSAAERAAGLGRPSSSVPARRPPPAPAPAMRTAPERPQTAPGPFGPPPVAPEQRRPATAPGPFGPPEPPPRRPPPPARPPASRAPLPGPVSAGLSDSRVRELHQRLVDAQRQLKTERAVSVEGLAKTLREAEKKLRSQHGDRKIDFDVVVKDGKAVVKPILR
jgi:hypothetical protein